MDASFSRSSAVYGITKTSHVESEGIASDLLMTGTEFAVKKGVPFLAKKTVEAGRYYASDALRKKAIGYGMKLAKPAIDKISSELLDQFSTLVRLNQPGLFFPIWRRSEGSRTILRSGALDSAIRSKGAPHVLKRELSAFFMTIALFSRLGRF